MSTPEPAAPTITVASSPAEVDAAQGWLHSNMSKDEATQLVAGKPDGTFFVRTRAKGGFALTVVYQARATHHSLKCPAEGNAIVGKAELPVSGLSNAVAHLRAAQSYWPVPLKECIPSSSQRQGWSRFASQQGGTNDASTNDASTDSAPERPVTASTPSPVSSTHATPEVTASTPSPVSSTHATPSPVSSTHATPESRKESIRLDTSDGKSHGLNLRKGQCTSIHYTYRSLFSKNGAKIWI